MYSKWLRQQYMVASFSYLFKRKKQSRKLSIPRPIIYVSMASSLKTIELCWMLIIALQWLIILWFNIASFRPSKLAIEALLIIN